LSFRCNARLIPIGPQAIPGVVPATAGLNLRGLAQRAPGSPFISRFETSAELRFLQLRSVSKSGELGPRKFRPDFARVGKLSPTDVLLDRLLTEIGNCIKSSQRSVSGPIAQRMTPADMLESSE